MSNVVVVGSFNVDHVWRCEALPIPGATLAGHYHTGPGGKGFNQAIAARRAAAQTHFICAIGEDVGGVLAQQLAAADGINLIAQAGVEPTGTAGIYVDRHGNNSIVIGAGANAELSTDSIQAQQALIAQSKVLLVQLESPLPAITHALTLARENRVITVLNPAPANAVINAQLLKLADILTPNESEFAALLARHVGERLEASEVATLDNTRLHALCRELSNQSIIITLGADGVFVSHAPNQYWGDKQNAYRLKAQTVQVVDTTGAGDAFNGALAAALAQAPQAPFIEKVQFANYYAARSTETAGAALAMPWLAYSAAH